MLKYNSKAKNNTTLREQAEKSLSERPRKEWTPDDILKLVHELEVHQIELEMQNEELRRAQLEIEESREKYFELYDFAPVGYLTLNEKGIISELNLRAAELLGLERKYLVNTPFSLYIKPESQDVFYHHRRQVFESSTKQTCELVLKKNDGTFFSVRLDSIGADVDGQKIIRAVLTDITARKEAEKEIETAHKELEKKVEERTAELRVEIAEHKQTEEALHMSERRERERAEELATMLEAVPIPVIIVHDPNATHMMGNRAADELLRQPHGAEASLSAPPELKPSHFRAIKDGRELKLDELPAQRAALGEHVRDLEFSLVFDDGTTRQLLGYGTPLRDEQGHPHGAVHVLVDITDRKHAEEALRDSERLYRAIGESIDYGVWVCAPDGRNIYASDSFLKMVGITQEQCSNFGWGDVLHPDDTERTIAAWKECVATGGTWDIEHRFRGVDGQWHPVLARGVPVRNERGEIIYWAGINLDITERKQAEEALRDSEERFRILANAIPQLAWIAESDGYIFWYNQRWYDYTGTTPEEMEGWGWQRVHDPKLLPEVLKKWNDSIATGLPFDMVFPLRGADGELRPFLTRMMPLRDSSGKVIQWFGTNTDITEQRRMEEELRKSRDELELRVQERTEQLANSEKEFRLLAEAMPQIVWITGADGSNIYFNQQWVDYTGLTLEESYGHGWNKPFHPDDQQLAWDAWQNAVTRNGTYSLECRLRKADGTYRWWLIRGVPVIDEKGDISKWFGTCTDIEEIKRKEEVVQLVNAYNRSLIEASLDPLVAVDLEGHISDVNAATEQVTGCARNDLIGTYFWDYFTEQEMARSGYERAFKEGLVRDYALEIRHKDGHVTPVLYNASVYRDEAGKVIGIFAAARDITERKEAEEQLRQSQKMEAIGTLAGGIAHDFNNMLAGILGFTEMAIEDVPDHPDVQRSLQNVLKATKRARDLVKQILAFSRKTSHERSPLSLSPLVKETVQLLRASIPTTIEIRPSITATSDAILAAPVEVQQILMNLATNASLAMQEKGGTVEVSLTDIDFKPDSPVFGADVLPGEYVQLVVKDTGTGMSPDVMKRVFEPFFSTREVGKGTGMGLAVVYGIVKDLQGTITVESELGAGSTFSVFLPKVKTGVQAEVVQPVEIPGGNERILFVDDEEILIEWGRATLERLGYKVTAMRNSREALKTFSMNPALFDLVITDYAMPQIAGTQLTKEILTIRGDIPIILCTGHSDNISPETSRKIGVREFLTKPVSKQELAEVVRRVLDGKDWQVK